MKKLYDLVSEASRGETDYIGHDLAMGTLERTYLTVVEDIEKRHADDLPQRD